MLLSLALLGIILSIILLVNNAGKFRSTIYLCIFFFSISLYGLIQYVILYSKSELFIRLMVEAISYSGFILYLPGPMLYWYVRSVLTDHSHLGKRDFWHLLPALIYLAASIPRMLVAHPESFRIAAQMIADSNYLKDYHTTILHDVFSVAAIYLSRPVLVLGYTLWSIGLVISYLRHRRDSQVFSRQYFMIHWLSLLLGFLLILTVNQLLLMIRAFSEEHSSIYYTLNVLQVLSALTLAGLLISPFFFPRILYGLPRVPLSAISGKTDAGEKDPKYSEVKNHNTNLETDYIQTINRKTEVCMKELKPYLQPDCNLVQLSVQLHIPVHHLAWYFREVKMMSFTDYRNQWRIRHAKALIEEGKAREKTLEAIGLESGFSNRIAFITAFKRIEGVSPHVFAAKCTA